MPVQDLQRAPPPRFAWRIGGGARRAGPPAGGGHTLAIVTYGVSEMIAIVVNEHMSFLQALFVGVFAVSLAWIANSAATTFAGLLPARSRRLAMPLDAATAQPQSHGAGDADLQRGPAAHNDGAARDGGGAAEMRRRARLRDRAAVGFHARRRLDPRVAGGSAAARVAGRDHARVVPAGRWENRGRKAGNLQEFVERWGAALRLHGGARRGQPDGGRDAPPRWCVHCRSIPNSPLLQTVPLLIGPAQPVRTPAAVRGPHLRSVDRAWPRRHGPAMAAVTGATMPSCA